MHIRNASLNDLKGIMAVEQSWHEEGRAEEDKFISRINKFSQGFFLAVIEQNGKEKIVATITSMPYSYQPEKVSLLKNWDEVTKQGYLPDVIDTKNNNTLYIVSGIVDANYRGNDIFAPMVSQIVELATNLGYRYVIAGAVIPGFKKYHQKNPDQSAYEYCSTRKGHSLIDPLLAMYEKLNFHVPDSQHVIEEYFPDDASMNYAAIVVKDLS